MAQSRSKDVFKVGDYITIRDTGEYGRITAVLGLGCYMVKLEDWAEECQVSESMLASNEE